MHIDGLGQANGTHAVDKMSELAKEREKTRRMVLVIASALLIFGCSALLYCPKDKKTEGIIIGAVMIVLALGAVGSTAFRIKLPSVEIQSSNQSYNSTNLPSE